MKSCVCWLARPYDEEQPCAAAPYGDDGDCYDDHNEAIVLYREDETAATFTGCGIEEHEE
jgi:hypothetical protein